MPAFASPRNGVPHVAYGETIAPPKVDTLRDENCPICGEDDAYNGHKCSICGYVSPPSPFSDPDLGMASRIDLRTQQDDFANSQIPDADRMAELDQGATLICDNCGTEFPQEPPESVDTAEPAPDVDAEETEEGEGATEGDVCPACGKGVLQAQDDVSAEGAAEGVVDPEEIGAEEDLDAKGEAPPFGGSDSDDEPEQDEEEKPPGVPVKSSDGPQDDEDDDDEDEDGPVKKNPFKAKQ